MRQTGKFFRDMHSQRVEKVFSPRCADFETFKKVSKSCLIERAVGFLPPRTHPPLLCPGHLLRGFLTVSFSHNELTVILFLLI